MEKAKDNGEILVSSLRNQVPGAFEELYDRYSGALMGVIVSVTGDGETARDVLQETFVKVWKNIHKYDESKGRLFTWLLNIARNTAIDHLRNSETKIAKGKLTSEKQTESALESRMGSVVINTDIIGLKEVVDRLSDEQRIVIEKAYFGGLTREDIAEELGLPVGTVKTRLRSALIRLREILNVKESERERNY